MKLEEYRGPLKNVKLRHPDNGSEIIAHCIYPTANGVALWYCDAKFIDKRNKAVKYKNFVCLADILDLEIVE